ncbi:MAG TPA: hypothetical protein VK427_05080, partial [Kofleriaceae bacterium]|nr:hypothetical protein [Kofleriaceae bacterium]
MGRWTVAVLVVVGSFTRVLAQPIDPWADDPPPSSTAADPVRTPAPVAVDPPDAEDVVPEDLRAEPTTDPEDDVISDE